MARRLALLALPWAPLFAWRGGLEAKAGYRLRCRRGEGNWSYGRVAETTPDLAVRWDHDPELVNQVDLSGYEVEFMEADPVDELLEGLEDARRSDLEGESRPEAILFSLEDVQEELDAFRWLSAEVMHQRRELEELEEENRRLLEEQAEVRKSYEDMMEEAESEADGGEKRRKGRAAAVPC